MELFEKTLSTKEIYKGRIITVHEDEIELPDDILSMYFDVADNTLKLSPNETKEISEILNIYPSESWLATLEYALPQLPMKTKCSL